MKDFEDLYEKKSTPEGEQQSAFKFRPTLIGYSKLYIQK